MRKLYINFALVLAILAVSACTSAQLATASSDLLAINTAIAEASTSVATFINSKIMVANTYFQEIAATGVLSQAAIALEAQEVAKAEAILANPPTTLAAVAVDLAAIFTNIQNLTTVSPTVPALVPST